MKRALESSESISNNRFCRGQSQSLTTIEKVTVGGPSNEARAAQILQRPRIDIVIKDYQNKLSVIGKHTQLLLDITGLLNRGTILGFDQKRFICELIAVLIGKEGYVDDFQMKQYFKEYEAFGIKTTLPKLITNEYAKELISLINERKKCFFVQK